MMCVPTYVGRNSARRDGRTIIQLDSISIRLSKISLSIQLYKMTSRYALSSPDFHVRAACHHAVPKVATHHHPSNTSMTTHHGAIKFIHVQLLNTCRPSSRTSLLHRIFPIDTLELLSNHSPRPSSSQSRVLIA